eukprot:CAMPEP_0185042180 /NCGR_PEP_ID=MMETSP1103-20130426/42197_1 /TAXON_ID=36769 /ORGANISM="Paraphysomonas bandaiensis, Strain Caron Lab Isolate" /LENGTH=987 /DNA_ID=CAMNT_0027582203 /DNA_START=139 /DNA_END=3102 /DNA_ORIENTATION=+
MTVKATTEIIPGQTLVLTYDEYVNYNYFINLSNTSLEVLVNGFTSDEDLSGTIVTMYASVGADNVPTTDDYDIKCDSSTFTSSGSSPSTLDCRLSGLYLSGQDVVNIMFHAGSDGISGDYVGREMSITTTFSPDNLQATNEWELNQQLTFHYAEGGQYLFEISLPSDHVDEGLILYGISNDEDLSFLPATVYIGLGWVPSSSEYDIKCDKLTYTEGTASSSTLDCRLSLESLQSHSKVYVLFSMGSDGQSDTYFQRSATLEVSQYTQYYTATIGEPVTIQYSESGTQYVYVDLTDLPLYNDLFLYGSTDDVDLTHVIAEVYLGFNGRVPSTQSYDVHCDRDDYSTHGATSSTLDCRVSSTTLKGVKSITMYVYALDDGLSYKYLLREMSFTFKYNPAIFALVPGEPTIVSYCEGYTYLSVDVSNRSASEELIIHGSTSDTDITYVLNTFYIGYDWMPTSTSAYNSKCERSSYEWYGASPNTLDCRISIADLSDHNTVYILMYSSHDTNYLLRDMTITASFHQAAYDLVVDEPLVIDYAESTTYIISMDISNRPEDSDLFITGITSDDDLTTVLASLYFGLDGRLPYSNSYDFMCDHTSYTTYGASTDTLDCRISRFSLEGHTSITIKLYTQSDSSSYSYFQRQMTLSATYQSSVFELLPGTPLVVDYAELGWYSITLNAAAVPSDSEVLITGTTDDTDLSTAIAKLYIAFDWMPTGSSGYDILCTPSTYTSSGASPSALNCRLPREYIDDCTSVNILMYTYSDDTSTTYLHRSMQLTAMYSPIITTLLPNVPQALFYAEESSYSFVLDVSTRESTWDVLLTGYTEDTDISNVIVSLYMGFGGRIPTTSAYDLKCDRNTESVYGGSSATLDCDLLAEQLEGYTKINILAVSLSDGLSTEYYQREMPLQATYPQIANATRSSLWHPPQYPPESSSTSASASRNAPKLLWGGAVVAAVVGVGALVAMFLTRQQSIKDYSMSYSLLNQETV